MIGMVFLAAAAAHAPVVLARNDDARWRLFVRASVQGPPAAGRAPGASRLRQLQGVVRQLGDDAPRRTGIEGPRGL